MKLNFYKKIKDRAEFAAKLSYFINHQGFEPYKPNENDDSFWTIDANNDWKIKFHSDTEFELVYRYDRCYVSDTSDKSDSENEKPSSLLSKWIAWKLNLRCVTET